MSNSVYDDKSTYSLTKEDDDTSKVEEDKSDEGLDDFLDMLDEKEEDKPLEHESDEEKELENLKKSKKVDFTHDSSHDKQESASTLAIPNRDTILALCREVRDVESDRNVFELVVDKRRVEDYLKGINSNKRERSVPNAKKNKGHEQRAKERIDRKLANESEKHMKDLRNKLRD